MTQQFDLQYFPNICYVKSLINSTHVFFNKYDTHRKMSFVNKCIIVGSNGLIKLSVPILHGRNQKANIVDLKIDYSTKWQSMHWRSIESCYGKSPFFLYYSDAVKEIIFGGHPTLVELNKKALEWILKICKADINIVEPTMLDVHLSRKNLYRWLPNNYASADCGIRPYPQVFSNKQPFQKNLSILDAIFCLGPALPRMLAADGNSHKVE